MTTQYPEITNYLQNMIAKNNDPKLITRWINRNFHDQKKIDIKKIYAELAQ